MLQVHQLTFNPFSENTYLIENENKEVIIIDPGMYDDAENIRFDQYINENGLIPTQLILTHAHLDHIFGVNHINALYGFVPMLHRGDQPVYESAEITTRNYGLHMNPLPTPNYSLEEGRSVMHGENEIKVLFTPGHSPGSVSFILENEKIIIGGDVLFQGSIGRTDLPGGDYNTLMSSIKTKLLPLGDDYLVYSGHGPMTTIGQEKVSNYYLNQASF